MATYATIGLDLAKNVFQVYGVDGNGSVVIDKKLRRDAVRNFFANLPACLVGMEACAGAHYWGRQIQALGHEVRLIPPKYVRPYVKRNKNDRADAEAIWEAVQRPNMRFVPMKDQSQQAMLVLHRTRELLVRQRTQLVNALRGHCAEFGVIAPQGIGHVRQLITQLAETVDGPLPAIVREVLQTIVDQMHDTERKIKNLELVIAARAKESDICRRLMTIPGIGVITATALAATVGDPANFKSGRHFAAWLGLVPRQHSSGGKERLGGISKAGDGYLRRLLVHGARAVTWRSASHSSWFTELRRRRPVNVAIVALANKTARIAWAVMRHEEVYRMPNSTVQA